MLILVTRCEGATLSNLVFFGSDVKFGSRIRDKIHLYVAHSLLSEVKASLPAQRSFTYS